MILCRINWHRWSRWVAGDRYIDTSWNSRIEWCATTGRDVSRVLDLIGLAA